MYPGSTLPCPTPPCTPLRVHPGTPPYSAPRCVRHQGTPWLGEDSLGSRDLPSLGRELPRGFFAQSCLSSSGRITGLTKDANGQERIRLDRSRAKDALITLEMESLGEAWIPGIPLEEGRIGQNHQNRHFRCCTQSLCKRTRIPTLRQEVVK